MKNLINLQLSIPTIDELTTRTLMGGDGYIPENDFKYGLPDPEINIEIPEIVAIGKEPDVPNAPETEYDIPDPDMEMIPNQSNPSDQSDQGDPRDPDDYDNDPSDSNINPNEDRDDNQSSEGNNQGNTGDHGDSDGNGIPDWADIVMSHLFSPLKNYAQGLDLNFAINPNLPIDKEAQYNPETNTITLRSGDPNDNAIRGLTHELVHAIQDKLGLADVNKGHANAEYQAYMITDIIYTLQGLVSNGLVPVEKDKNYEVWLIDIINADGTFNKGEFNDHWKDYFELFLERYDDTPKYQSQNDTYDWKWDEIINILFSDIKDEVGGVVILPGGDVGGQ